MASSYLLVFMDDTRQADMVVNWWNQTMPEVESGAAGLSKSQTWGKYIAQNDIYLSLHHRDGQPHSPQEIYATALHEIGHSLGIKVHSDNPGDIMYHITTEHARLSQRDINTMLRVYASKPDFTNPPGYHLSRFEDFKKTQKGKGGFWIPIIIPIPM